MPKRPRDDDGQQMHGKQSQNDRSVGRNVDNYAVRDYVPRWLGGKTYKDSFRSAFFHGQAKHSCPAVLTQDGLLGYIIGEAQDAPGNQPKYPKMGRTSDPGSSQKGPDKKSAPPSWSRGAAWIVGQQTDAELVMFGFLPKDTAALSVPQKETGEPALLLCYNPKTVWFYENSGSNVLLKANTHSFTLWGKGKGKGVDVWLKQQEERAIEYMATMYADTRYSRDLERIAEDTLNGKSGQPRPRKKPDCKPLKCKGTAKPLHLVKGPFWYKVWVDAKMNAAAQRAKSRSAQPKIASSSPRRR